MKNFFSIFIILLVFCSGCFTQKDYIAEYDFNYGASFKKYKTYGFVENPIKDSTDFYQTIERTITSRLGSQGFKFQDEKPDLLINYKIFYDQVKYRGYEQPNFDYWLQRQGTPLAEKEDEEEEEKEKDPKNKDENYNNVKYTDNSGMLVIFVIDNRRGNTVWQGYTAASFDFYSPEIQSDLTRATYKVMDQFRVLTR
jgi:hypothetical protein